jgi:hypothetical protein
MKLLEQASWLEKHRAQLIGIETAKIFVKANGG